MTFEESAKKLAEMSEKIKDEDITLEEALQCYEEGIKSYEECSKILKDARQKIEIYEERVQGTSRPASDGFYTKYRQ